MKNNIAELKIILNSNEIVDYDLSGKGIDIINSVATSCVADGELLELLEEAIKMAYMHKREAAISN